MEEIKNVEWNDPNERKQVIFIINGINISMDEEEYNTHIMSGNNNPVLIGNTLYMVNDSDYELIRKIEAKMDDMKLDILPQQISNRKIKKSRKNKK